MTLQVQVQSSGGCSNTSSLVIPAGWSFYTIAPCRLVDTRQTLGTYGGPALQGGTERAFPVNGHRGIPADAQAVALIVTVLNSTAAGDLQLYPSGIPAPNASAISFQAGVVRANNAVIGLIGNPFGSLTVLADISGSDTTDLIIDVSGYFK